MANLEEILAEGEAAANARHYEINTNYHDPGNERWWCRNWVSDGYRKPYDVGDLLVVYLGKENNGPQRCPAILRVTVPPERDRDFVLAERDFEAAERWPFVTRTEVVDDVPVFEGTPLSAAKLTYLQVQRGRKITRNEFEALAWPIARQRRM